MDYIQVLLAFGFILVVSIITVAVVPRVVRAYRVRRFQEAVIEHFGPQLDNYRDYVQDELFGNAAIQETVAQIADNKIIDEFAKGLVDIELNNKEEDRGNQTAG